MRFRSVARPWAGTPIIDQGSCGTRSDKSCEQRVQPSIRYRNFRHRRSAFESESVPLPRRIAGYLRTKPLGDDECLWIMAVLEQNGEQVDALRLDEPQYKGLNSW